MVGSIQFISSVSEMYYSFSHRRFEAGHNYSKVNGVKSSGHRGKKTQTKASNMEHPLVFSFSGKRRNAP